MEKKTIQDINLQGRGFERFVDENSTEKNHKKLEDMTQEELEEILNDVYIKRVEEIAGATISMVSVGPRRDQNIFLREI